MKSLVLLAALALPAPAAELTAPPMPTTITDLHTAFTESVDEQRKAEILERISKTSPVSNRDLSALFDLFMRFADTGVRDACLKSVDLLDRRSSHLENLIVGYLEQPEPEALLFGIRAALRTRSAKSLPLVRKIAERPFPFEDVAEAALVSERNAWWTQYEALTAVAQWEGTDAMPLLKKKTNEAPAVARVMAMYLWKDSLPLLEKWARSSRKNQQEKARQGLESPVPGAELRETRPAMLAILRDRKAPRRLRHPIALKVGISSNEEEVTELLKERATLKDPEDQLLYAAALFASRSPQVIPLLDDFARNHPNARTREGARSQLKDLLSPKDYRALVEWAAAHEPDPDNRQEAQKELKTLTN